MTTVAELIKYLKTLPGETQVQVVDRDIGYVNLDIEEHTYFYDFTGNELAVGKPHENLKVLELGLD